MVLAPSKRHLGLALGVMAVVTATTMCGPVVLVSESLRAGRRLRVHARKRRRGAAPTYSDSGRDLGAGGSTTTAKSCCAKACVAHRLRRFHCEVGSIAKMRDGVW
jgi:hypothetical protein